MLQTVIISIQFILSNKIGCVQGVLLSWYQTKQSLVNNDSIFIMNIRRKFVIGNLQS